VGLNDEFNQIKCLHSKPHIVLYFQAASSASGFTQPGSSGYRGFATTA